MTYSYLIKVNYIYEGEDADLSCYQFKSINAENRSEALEKAKELFPYATGFEFKEKTPAK